MAFKAHGPGGCCCCNAADVWAELLAAKSTLSATLDSTTSTAFLPSSGPGFLLVDGALRPGTGSTISGTWYGIKGDDDVSISIEAGCVNGAKAFRLQAAYRCIAYATGTGFGGPTYFLPNPYSSGLTSCYTLPSGFFLNRGAIGNVASMESFLTLTNAINTTCDFTYVHSVFGEAGGGTNQPVMACSGSGGHTADTQYEVVRFREWYVDDIASLPTGDIILTPAIDVIGLTAAKVSLS